MESLKQDQGMLLIATPAVPSPDWGTFFLTIVPYLTVFGLVWKAIDKVFEYFGKQGRAATLEIVKGYVTPQMDGMDRKLDSIKSEHEIIKKLLEDIKKKQ